MGVEAGSRRRYHNTPGADPKRLQRLLSLPLADNRALGGRLAGVVAKGTPKTTMSTPSSSSMSFSDAFYKAKTVAETEKPQEGDAHRAQTTTVHKPRNTRDDEEDKEVKLCIPLRLRRSLRRCCT